MNLDQFRHGFQLDDHLVFYNQICDKLADYFAFIINMNGRLLLNAQPPFFQFYAQCIFIYFLDKTISQRVIPLIGRLDDLLGDFTVKIIVHDHNPIVRFYQRLSASLCVEKENGEI